MVLHNWLTFPSLVWLSSCFLLFVVIDAQLENVIGAHRAFEKTSFSCVGRPAGYYADIETGCQIYHMCDGLGRQFSYSCPNTTLFQQRMLICDHWYMVNCSRAESDYAANLLIGQRDKPFVNDEENSLRTPRPDLLDRPYAPDYSGESFRNQYKQFPAIQNHIQDSDAQKFQQKLDFSAQLAPGQQRWKIPPPSRTILPPAYEAQLSEETTASNPAAVRFIPHSTVHPTTAPPTAATPVPTNKHRHQPINRFNSAALHQRPHQQPLRGQSGEQHDDLGTSHSTRYNTSADFNSAESTSSKKLNTFTQSKSNRNSFTSPSTTAATASTTTAATASTTTARPSTANSGNKGISVSPTQDIPIKVPSKVYEPPFIYPIYNENDTFTTQAPLRVSSATPFTSAPVVRTTLTTTPIPPPNRPTTLAGKPFSVPSASTLTTTAPITNFGRNQNDLIQQQFNQQNAKEARTPIPAQGFKPRPHSNDIALKTSRSDGKDIELPSKQLLPPYQEFVEHDIATTQGPPIYYEWKIPSNGLEPPKLDPPIGVDGREYTDAIIDYNTISGNSSEQSDSGSYNIPTTRTPISRSIKETGQPNSVFRINANRSATPSTPSSTDKANTASDATPTATSDLTQLRKDLSVPEFSFPLEPVGRTGYLSTDTYNSFQLKIPEHRSGEAADAHQHWFGENPKCPECHPSFVVPGTCEPCLRR